MKERNKLLERTLNGLDLLGKIVLILVMAFPFFWMISTALQTLQETLSVPLTILPASPQWSNFPEVFKTINVFGYLKNSLIVCVSVVFIQYLIIVPCAYSLSKFDYKAKPLIFALVMLGQMIPMQITFLPIYFMFSKMGLMDTYTALIVPFISNPFGIFMLRQYFMQVPSEVIEAAKAVHAHDFIMRLPQGYDTVIGESGGNLSQGQKQLLCIARVMLCLPPMLILDEATSSIDTRTEIRIQKAFDTMMRGRTSFIVAHRLSTIREADVILVMRDGHIVEQGTHGELLARNGFYAGLYHSQFAH